MLIIGIAGGSGSGKSTVAKLIEEEFKGDVTLIRHDDYYKAQHDKTYEERTKQIMTALTHSIRNLCPSISRR